MNCKQLILTALGIAACTPAWGGDFFEGKPLLDVTLGVGAVDLGTTKANFSQRIAMDWRISSDFLPSDMQLSLGFAVGNKYGGTIPAYFNGHFNYNYIKTITVKYIGAPAVDTRETINRTGSGIACADITRDDMSFMPTVSLHYDGFDRWDLYCTFGLGAGFTSYSVSHYKNTLESPFGKANVFESIPDPDTNALTTVKYEYDDLSHVKFHKPSALKTKASFAASFYLGARYYLTENWALTAQLGMIDCNVRDHGDFNSYNIFAVGATYKF